MTEASGPGTVVLGTADRARAVAAIRGMLRSGDTGEDALIGTLADSAIGIAELFTGTVLLRRPMRETIPARQGWTALTARPVRAITAVAAIAGDGAETALPVDGHAVDIAADGTGWVRSAAATQRIAVTLEAGCAQDWDAIPAAVRHGIVLLAAHLFTARDGAGAPPAAVAALWRPYRRIALMAATR